jgi:hypothetical protein
MPDDTKYTISQFRAAIDGLRKPTPHSDRCPCPLIRKATSRADRSRRWTWKLLPLTTFAPFFASVRNLQNWSLQRMSKANCRPMFDRAVRPGMLWALHEQIVDILSSKMLEEKARLEKRLGELHLGFCSPFS